MKIGGDNYEIDLSKGKLTLNLYSDKEKASIKMSVKIPEERLTEPRHVLAKATNILDIVRSTLQWVKEDIEKVD